MSEYLHLNTMQAQKCDIDDSAIQKNNSNLSIRTVHQNSQNNHLSLRAIWLLLFN